MIEKKCQNKENFNKNKYEDFCLVADIGATNSRIAVMGKCNKIQLILVHQYKTKEISKIYFPLNKILEEAKNKYKIEIDKLCIGCAGPKNNGFIKLSNRNFAVSRKEILKKTLLKNVYLLNDFEMLSYSIPLIKEKALVKLSKAESKGSIRAIIGPGTGLGKSIIVYDPTKKIFFVIPSEGGNTRIFVETEEDIKLFNYLNKKKKKIIEEEDIISGRGIEHIFDYFCEEKRIENKLIKKIKNSENKAELISKYAKKNKICEKSMRTFMKYFIRAINNFCLVCLPYGGLYISGAISRKNFKLLKEEFENEFFKFKPDIMKKIPVYVIIDENMSLIGGANFIFNYLK